MLWRYTVFLEIDCLFSSSPREDDSERWGISSQRLALPVCFGVIFESFDPILHALFTYPKILPDFCSSFCRIFTSKITMLLNRV